MHLLDPGSVTRHVDRVYRGAWALCGSREDAEDLVQATFARTLARPRLLHGDNDLYYLMRVLGDTFLARRTRMQRSSSRSTEPYRRTRAPAVVRSHALEVHETYARIGELPDDLRLAVVAVDVLGLSCGEASRALKTPEATIAARLVGARKRLAVALLSL
jgi:RNA polymerase sigma-70 factor, ECF subfamily